MLSSWTVSWLCNMCRFKEIEFLLKENIFIADYFHFIFVGATGKLALADWNFSIRRLLPAIELSKQKIYIQKKEAKLLPLNFDS